MQTPRPKAPSPPAAGPARARPAASAHAPPTARAHSRVRSDHSQETAEDYAEAVGDLIEATGQARVTDLARALGVSHVTVVRTVARLRRDGIVTTEPYKSVLLTEAGRRMALRARRRHRVVLDFLRAVGVSETTARADAEGIEHHVSAETLKAFAKFLKERATHP